MKNEQKIKSIAREACFFSFWSSFAQPLNQHQNPRFVDPKCSLSSSFEKIKWTFFNFVDHDLWKCNLGNFIHTFLHNPQPFLQLYSKLSFMSNDFQNRKVRNIRNNNGHSLSFKKRLVVDESERERLTYFNIVSIAAAAHSLNFEFEQIFLCKPLELQFN